MICCERCEVERKVKNVMDVRNEKSWMKEECLWSKEGRLCDNIKQRAVVNAGELT